MKLYDFWLQLPGTWNLERFHHEKHAQTGNLTIENECQNFYRVTEKGFYITSPEQTFFRHYRYGWEEECLNIYGTNPKDGLVLLHTLKDFSKLHTHLCNKDTYILELLDISKNSWSTLMTINGPNKNLKLKSFYKRT